MANFSTVSFLFKLSESLCPLIVHDLLVCVVVLCELDCTCTKSCARITLVMISDVYTSSIHKQMYPGLLKSFALPYPAMLYSTRHSDVCVILCWIFPFNLHFSCRIPQPHPNMAKLVTNSPAQMLNGELYYYNSHGKLYVLHA